MLHVRDLSHEDTAAQSADVEHILEELGIEPHDPRIVEVWNKIDLLDDDRRMALINAARRGPVRQRPFVVSALTGEGVNDLLNGIEARLSASHTSFDLELPPEDGEGLSWLYAQTQIISREDSDDGMKLSVRVAPERTERLLRRFPDARKSEPERSTARRRGSSRGF